MIFISGNFSTGNLNLMSTNEVSPQNYMYSPTTISRFLRSIHQDLSPCLRL